MDRVSQQQSYFSTSVKSQVHCINLPFESVTSFTVKISGILESQKGFCPSKSTSVETKTKDSSKTLEEILYSLRWWCLNLHQSTYSRCQKNNKNKSK